MREEQIARSWDANADAWTRVVRNHGIESRRLATDAAIVDAVLSLDAKRVLDVGCGEGWLARVLSGRGLETVGVDGSASLIESARAEGGGEFHQLSYDQLAAHPEKPGLASYDVVVCNFALLQEDLGPLLRSLRTVLQPDGALVIQTVHPWTARGDDAYADGWRTEAFASFAEQFTEPMPWYYRTLESWTRLLEASGFVIQRIIEPKHPETTNPLSLLVVATKGY